MNTPSAAQKRSRLFVELILKSWWVILFIFLCTFSYEQASLYKKREQNRLSTQYTSLLQEKVDLLSIQDDLLLQIESRHDPAWIEMVLMRGLGLVPEGEIKVHFYTP
ncbi:MAG: hypothetical protein KDK55_06150 [Chlamydiia bacterium]|nr:hypothetical protein [Chlamydiia bacterium]